MLGGGVAGRPHDWSLGGRDDDVYKEQGKVEDKGQDPHNPMHNLSGRRLRRERSLQGGDMTHTQRGCVLYVCIHIYVCIYIDMCVFVRVHVCVCVCACA